MNRSPRSNVRRLAIGRLISVTGGAAAYTALMFTVWNETHSATWQSVALLLTFGVVGILSPLTGHLGDRFDRRKVMMISEAIAAAVFFAMAFVDSPEAILIALAFAVGDGGVPVLVRVVGRDPQPRRDARRTSRGRTACSGSVATPAS